MTAAHEELPRRGRRRRATGFRRPDAGRRRPSNGPAGGQAPI